MLNISGMWADDSDEDERPSFKGGGSGGSDLTSGISFISGGFKKKSELPVDTEMLEKGPKDDRFSVSFSIEYIFLPGIFMTISIQSFYDKHRLSKSPMAFPLLRCPFSMIDTRVDINYFKQC